MVRKADVIQNINEQLLSKKRDRQYGQFSQSVTRNE
jgi:hypothetical protein